MSVNTEQGPDRSTQGANWGTLVILLVVVIIGIVVAWTVMQGSRNPALNAAPVLSNPMPTQPAAPQAGQNPPPATPATGGV